jgi:hypothetical protein
MDQQDRDCGGIRRGLLSDHGQMAKQWLGEVERAPCSQRLFPPGAYPVACGGLRRAGLIAHPPCDQALRTDQSRLHHERDDQREQNGRYQRQQRAVHEPGGEQRTDQQLRAEQGLLDAGNHGAARLTRGARRCDR